LFYSYIRLCKKIIKPDSIYFSITTIKERKISIDAIGTGSKYSDNLFILFEQTDVRLKWKKMQGEIFSSLQ